MIALLKHRKLIGAALIALAFAGVLAWLQITRARLEACNEKNARLVSEIASLVRESVQRKAEGKRAVEAARPVIERIERQREVIRQTAPSERCETPQAVLEAEL